MHKPTMPRMASFSAIPAMWPVWAALMRYAAAYPCASRLSCHAPRALRVLHIPYPAPPLFAAPVTFASGRGHIQARPAHTSPRRIGPHLPAAHNNQPHACFISRIPRPRSSPHPSPLHRAEGTYRRGPRTRRAAARTAPAAPRAHIPAPHWHPSTRRAQQPTPRVLHIPPPAPPLFAAPVTFASGRGHIQARPPHPPRSCAHRTRCAPRTHPRAALAPIYPPRIVTHRAGICNTARRGGCSCTRRDPASRAATFSALSIVRPVHCAPHSPYAYMSAPAAPRAHPAMPAARIAHSRTLYAPPYPPRRPRPSPPLRGHMLRLLFLALVAIIH